MRNNDTIFLEQAYQKIFEKKSFRKIISEEADNLTEFVKSREEDIKNLTDLYAKAKDGNVEDLEKANAALAEFNQKFGKLSPTPAAASAPAAPTPQVAPAATPAANPTPTVSPTPKSSVPLTDKEADEMAAQEPNAYVAPKTPTPQPVTPTPAQQAAPVQPQFKTNPQLAQNPAQVASSNPSQQELAKFQKETGTPFNPKSVNDKLNLSLMRKGKSTLNSQQANSYRKANPNWTPDTV